MQRQYESLRYSPRLTFTATHIIRPGTSVSVIHRFIGVSTGDILETAFHKTSVLFVGVELCSKQLSFTTDGGDNKKNGECELDLHDVVVVVVVVEFEMLCDD